MITRRAIAARFKAGESIEQIALAITGKRWFYERRQYVQHAIRQVMRRQE